MYKWKMRKAIIMNIIQRKDITYERGRKLHPEYQVYRNEIPRRYHTH